MQEHHIKITKTARYFQLGKNSDAINQVWFVCHGYGQLASFFIEHFEPLDTGERLIIAPEGLSRFYLNGVYGRIGATWMTREDRLNEVKDYVIYLGAVYQKIFEKVDRSKVKVSILGFSQGSATACRWMSLGDIKADQLILWAGLVPPELIEEKKLYIFQKIKLILVAGDRDEYANKEKILEQENQLKRHQVPYTLIKFDGGHQVDSDTLKKIAKKQI